MARRLNRIMNTSLRAATPFGRMAWVILLTCGAPIIYLSAAVELAPGNRPAARFEANPPGTLIAQAVPNQPRRSAPPVVTSGRDNVPVSMCILIDNSGSMYEKQNKVKAAALALVRASKPGDELCIVAFNDEVWLNADLTTDFNKVRNALMRVEARGGSALRDAINLSVDLVEERAHNRKVLVLITDGDDTTSSIPEEQVRDKIRKSGVLVYAIGLHNREAGKDFEATRTLRQLAALNGGSYFDPEGSADVESIASRIERDARNK